MSLLSSRLTTQKYFLRRQRPLRQRRLRSRLTARRRGMAVVWLALTMVLFLGVAALTVDQGFHLTRKAQAQKAADAAALAGAFRLSQFDSVDNAKAKAQEFAGLNNYTNGVNGAVVTTEYPVTSIPNAPPNWFRVTVRRAEPMLFGGAFTALLGQRVTSRLVGASAVALYTTLAPMSITGGGAYGNENGPVTLSLFGPDGYYNNGDCYSVETLPNGQPNPLFVRQLDGYGQGYDFTLNVPTNFSTTLLELFDPDCYNAGGDPNAQQGVRVDELRRSDGGTGNSSHATTTRYRVYADNGTPNDPRDDILVAERSYGNDSSTDMKWNRSFSFNRRNYSGQQFRINVTPTNGSSENGFQLRAGPSRGSTAPFNPANGTEITAQGHLPMNFNASGTTPITLGYVPAEAAGKKLEIRKFDTDVGSQSVTYTCDTLPGYSFTGVLSGQGEFKTDSVPVPDNYSGGNWKATYAAGAQDTSVWDMAYTGAGPGRPGGIKLVQ